MLCHTNNTVPHNNQHTTQTNNTAPHKQHCVIQQTTNNSCSACILSNPAYSLSAYFLTIKVPICCNAMQQTIQCVLLQCNATNNRISYAMQYSLTTALREPYQHTLCCNAVQYQLPESCNRSTSDLIFYMIRCDGNLVRMNHTYLSFTLQAIWEQMVLRRKPGQGGK